MSEKGNALSRNPNICASCSSMADGMDDSGLPETLNPPPQTAQPQPQDQPQQPPAPVPHHSLAA